MDCAMSFNQFIPTRILFGRNQLSNLHEQELPGKKALLVISKGKSARANGYLDKTQRQLLLAGVESVVFDQVESNPVKSTIMEGGRAAREHGCDFIVALGGGSCIDAAKAIAVMATNNGDFWDYVASGTGKRKKVASAPLPIVAITTTAGTGSEADPGAVISNEETQEKTGFRHPLLFPRLAVVDPELMRTVPPFMTACQGFDALFHSVEGYVSNGVNLMSDMYAITAIQNIGRYLARAVQNGDDLEARERIAFGNTLSSTVMCVGKCTSEHALEHAMSAFHPNLPHGAGLIIISKAYYTHLIRRHVCDERFIAMAQAMGTEKASSPMDFIGALEKLQKDCRVDHLKMSDYGISPKEFAAMTKNAKATASYLFECDRIPLTDEDCIAIYEASYA